MAQKIAYLTIDDAPSEDMKRKVDFLSSKKVSAIFFCEGSFLEKLPEPAIYAIKKGFVLGNHSYDHPHFSKLSLEDCFEQLSRTDKILDSIYKKAGVKRPAKVIRLPYFDKGGGSDFENGWPAEHAEFIQEIQDFLKKLGYEQPKFKGITYKWFHKARMLEDIDVGYTYDTLDWCINRLRLKGMAGEHGCNDLDALLKRMDEDVPEGGRGLNFPKSNEIIAMHDHEATAELFEPLIEKLLAKKLKFELPEF